jgi:hypothetical protein
VRSKEKSKVRVRPVAAAMANPSPTDTPAGKPSTAAATTASMPKTIRTMIFTSVHVTACTPPNMV